MLVGQLEPSLGDPEQFGFFLFARSLLRRSESFLSVATVLFGFADHAIAAETFRKNRVRGEDVDGRCQLPIGPRSNLFGTARLTIAARYLLCSSGAPIRQRC